jgi:hypothetical protein
MAEKNGWPFPLFSYMQGDAIGGDIVLLERRTVDASKPFRFNRFVQQQARTNGDPAGKESATINS